MAISSGYAQETPDTLNIAISLFPPCIIKNNGSYTGFDIDIWETIANELKLNFTYYQVDFENILDELISGRADVALAGITINSEREEIVDFSHHYLDSGLRIMVVPSARSGLFYRIRTFFTPAIIRGIFAMLLFIFLCGQVLWWSERGKDAINDKYIPGIFEAFWCVITTMTTVGYGDIAPRKWLGRIAAFLVMVTGIGLFGWIIGEFAAITTVQKMETSISSPEDLRGKTVATVKATTSVRTIKDYGAQVIEVQKPNEAYEKLLNEEVDAVVYDAPNLLYYVNHDGAGKVTLVGELFAHQYYSIAFPEGNPLREQVNRVLLKLKEKKRGFSVYNGIYEKWFGS